METAAGWIVLVFVLLVPAATLLGLLALGGHGLLYIPAYRRLYGSVPPSMGHQLRLWMRISEAVVRRRRIVLTASASAYAAGLALALLWPVPGLLLAFFGGLGLGYLVAAFLVQAGWKRLEPGVPDGPPMTMAQGIDLALRQFPVALVFGGCVGVLAILGLALVNRDLPWLPWLALAPAAQAWAGWAALRRRRRRSSGSIRT